MYVVNPLHILSKMDTSLFFYCITYKTKTRLNHRGHRGRIPGAFGDFTYLGDNLLSRRLKQIPGTFGNAPPALLSSYV